MPPTRPRAGSAAARVIRTLYGRNCSRRARSPRCYSGIGAGRRNRRAPSTLPQLILDLVQAGIHAWLVDAGRARQPDPANDVVADLDGHAAPDRDHAG